MNDLTVAAGGIGESLTLNVAPADRSRVEALLPFLVYGPDYSRAVVSNLRTYSLFVGRGELTSAASYLSWAEGCAPDER